MARFAVEILLKTVGGPQARADVEGIGAGARSSAPHVQRLAQQVLGFEANIKGLGTLAAKAFAGFSVIQIGRQILEETKAAATAHALLTSAVRSTGGAAGFTADQLDAMANELSRLNGIDDEAIAGAEALMTRYSRIAGDIFPQAIQAAIDMASAQGKQIQSTADLSSEVERVGKLLGDPIRAMNLLKREGKGLGDEQIRLIQNFIKQNDLVGAQKVLLAELNRQYGGTAQALRKEIGGAMQSVSVAWKNLLEEFGQGLIVDSTGFENLATALSDPAVLASVRQLGQDFGTFVQFVGQLLEYSDEVDTFLNKLSRVQRWWAERVGGPQAPSRTGPYTPINLTPLPPPAAGPRLPPPKPPGDPKALAEAEKLQRAAMKAVEAARLELRNAEALLQARIIGTEAMKAQAAAQEALAKATAAGAGATSAQRLEIIRLSLATEAAKNGIERINQAEADAKRLFEASNAEMLRQLGILTNLEQIAIDFGRALSEANASQVEQGGAIATATTRERLDYAEQWRDSWKTSGQIVQEELDRIQASILKASEKHRAQVQVLAEQTLASWEPMLRGFEGIAADIGSALGNAFVTGRIEWEDLADSMKRTMASTIADIVSDFLSQWIRAIAQWLARWIASHQVAQAAAARTAAVNAAAGGAGAGGGGVTGSAGSVAALQAGSGGAGAWSTYGTYASYAFFAWVGYNIYKGFTKKRTTFGELSLEGVASGSQKLSDRLREVMAELRRGIEDIAKQWRLEVDRLGNIAIGVNSKGEIYVKTAIDAIGRVFRTMEEAVEYAKVQALKFAQFGEQTSALVQAAIRGSRALTVEGLGADIDFARMLEGLNLADVARQIQEFTQAAVDNFHRAMDLFRGDLAQAAVAVSSIMANFSSNLWGLYNNLQGIKEDPKAKWERDKIAYNAQRAIMIAQIMLLYEEVRARIAAYQAHRLQLAGWAGRTGGEFGAGEGGARGGQSGDRGKGGWNPNEPQQPDIRNPQNDPQLAALLRILDDLARALSGLPPAIEGAYPGAGRGGGRGGGGAGVQALADMVRESEWQRSLAGMSALGRSIAEINKKWDEAIKGANLHGNALERAKKRRDEAIKAADGNAEAIKRANEQYEKETRRIKRTQEELDAANRAREAEIALARQQAQQSAAQSFRQFMITGDPFAQLRDQSEALAKEIREAEFAAEREAAMLVRLNVETERRIVILQKEMQASVMEGLAKYVTDEALRVELLQQAAVIKFELEYANLIAQTELLRAQGKSVEILDRAIRNIGENMPKVLEEIRRGVAGIEDTFHGRRRPEGYYVGFGGEAAEDAGKKLADALREATEAFVDMARTIAKSNDELLLDSSRSALSPQAQRAEAYRQYQEILAKARAGDPTALREYVNARQTLLDIERAYSKSGPAFAELFERVIKEGAGLVLSADVEKKAVESLLAQQTADAAKNAAMLHEDLLAIRSSVIDGLAELSSRLGQAAIVNGIPRFASGGIATGPSLVGEGRYPEAVVPLPGGSVPVSFRGPAATKADPHSEKTANNTAAAVKELTVMRGEMTKLRTAQESLNVRLVQIENAQLRGASFRETEARKRGAA